MIQRADPARSSRSLASAIRPDGLERRWTAQLARFDAGPARGGRRIGQGFLSELEGRMKTGSAETLTKLAQRLDVPVGWLG